MAGANGNGVVARRARALLPMVVAAWLVSGCGLLDSGADITELSEELDRCRAEPGADGRSEIIVWLEVGVRQEQVTGLADLLASIPAVVEWSHVDIEETMARFEEHFADEPEIIELVAPEHLPTSFEVTLVDRAALDVLRSELEPFGIVTDIELAQNTDCDGEVDALREACDAEDPRELAVWLPPAADPSTIEAVATLLTESPAVTGFRYIDIDASLEEMAASLDEDVVGMVGRDQVLTRFDVSLAPTDDDIDDETVAALAERLVSMPGVDGVERRPPTSRLVPCLQLWTLRLG